MSNEINKAFVQQFSNNLLHLINQEGSMLLPTVRMEKVNGKYAHFDRLGRGQVTKRTSRHQDVTYNDTAHSRRRVALDDYEWADIIDNQDKLRMIIDPTSDYAKAAAWDLGIQIDEVVLGALNGNATSVDSNDTGSSIALPSTQIVDEDFSSADSNLTVEKLIESKRLLLKHAGALRGDVTCVVNASALTSLLNQEKATSADYASIKALVNGDLNSFMGYKFVTVKDGLLPGTADGTDTDPVRCFAYMQRSVGLAQAQLPTVTMDRIPTKGNATQVYASMSVGATRIEEEGVVAIECVQSA